MSCRPSPDFDLRRDQVVHAARALAEADCWPAVTMRRLAAALGVTQSVIYSAFDGRKALIDAAAVTGFGELSGDLEAVDAAPMARMRAYLEFAAAHPRTYEAMFLLPSGLPLAAEDTPASLKRAFACIREAVPDADGTRAEVAWAALRSLATLQADRRLRPSHAQSRFNLAHHMLTQPAIP